MTTLAKLKPAIVGEAGEDWFLKYLFLFVIFLDWPGSVVPIRQ